MFIQVESESKPCTSHPTQGPSRLAPSPCVCVCCAGFIIPNLHGVSMHMQGVVSASVFVGMLFGGLVAGLGADRLGRKPFL